MSKKKRIFAPDSMLLPNLKDSTFLKTGSYDRYS